MNAINISNGERVHKIEPTDDKATTVDGKGVTRYGRPSPAAQAFFMAFDTTIEQQSGERQVGRDDETEEELRGIKSETKSQRSHKSSNLIQQRIRTLGWRNRYSQQEYYPVTLHTNYCIHSDDDHPHQLSSPSHTDAISNPTNTTTTTSTARQQFTVRQVQRGEIDNTYGTGATVWPASMILIKYLERHASTLIQDKTILDLGTGTGITTIAASLLGATHIVCTDGEEPVVQLARDNIVAAAAQDRNQWNRTTTGTEQCSNITTVTDNSNTVYTIHNCTIEVQRYWWGTGTIHSSRMIPDRRNQMVHESNHPIKIPPTTIKPQYSFDIILVSDCVLPKLYPIEPLIDAIDQLLGYDDDENDKSNHNKNENTTMMKKMAIISYEYRYYPAYDPKTYVEALCTERKLVLHTVPISEHDPIYSIPEDIEIWHIYRL
jgi:ribosomal protein L11 methylase PrmA